MLKHFVVVFWFILWFILMLRLKEKNHNQLLQFICRSTNQIIGECPEVGLKLQDFLVNFFGSLPEEHKGILKNIKPL